MSNQFLLIPVWDTWQYISEAQERMNKAYRDNYHLAGVGSHFVVMEKDTEENGLVNG